MVTVMLAYCWEPVLGQYCVHFTCGSREEEDETEKVEKKKRGIRKRRGGGGGEVGGSGEKGEEREVVGRSGRRTGR